MTLAYPTPNELRALLPYLTEAERVELDWLLTTAPPTLAEFCELTTGFRLEPWQEIICSRLQQLTSQHGQRLLIHGPPQYGKSIIISQRFPAYVLGVNPLARVRVACYNVSHAERFSKVNLDLMRDPLFADAFPDPGARVPKVCPVEEWSTTAGKAKRDAQPSFMALGLGTGFTGMGVDTLIVDDPYKNAQEARSDAINTALWDWWTQVVLSRLNPATNVVVMFHRWWEGDFAGRLIEQGGWELLRFPAIADDGQDDPTGRQPGELLSNRYPPEHLARVKQEQGTAFEALYQGRPYPASGGMFKVGKVGFEAAAPAQAQRVRRWDMAATEGGGDYTVGVLVAIANGVSYVEDVVRGQWATDQRDKIIRETAERDARRGLVVHVGPQDPGSAGKDTARAFLKLLSGYSVAIERETGDKVVRADPFSSQWNAGNVKIVRGSWNDTYLNEMYAFPNGKHDDQVDASAGAYLRLTRFGATSRPDNPFY